MGTVPRIGLRRTQAVDDLLKGIWELRPELERKNTTTILLGLEAFFRECRAHAQVEYESLAPIASAFEEDAAGIESEPVTATGEDRTVSDDIEW